MVERLCDHCLSPDAIAAALVMPAGGMRPELPGKILGAMVITRTRFDECYLGAPRAVNGQAQKRTLSIAEINNNGGSCLAILSDPPDKMDL